MGEVLAGRCGVVGAEGLGEAQGGRPLRILPAPMRRTLHHRTYEREGREEISDVMAVCTPCHKFLHGLLPWGSAIQVSTDSLGYRGDLGMGLTPLWLEYLVEAAPELISDIDGGGRWLKRMTGGLFVEPPSDPNSS
jgi:hypothetical protein